MSAGADSLGWPKAWAQGLTSLWVIRVVLGLLLVCMVAVAAVVVVASPGDMTMSVWSMFVSAPMIFMMLYVARRRFRSQPRALRANGDPNSLFLPDVSELAALVALVVVTVSLVGFIVVQTVQMRGMEESFAILKGLLVVEWVLVGGLVLFVIGYAWNVRAVRPGVEITATGLRRRTTWSEHSITWDQVFRVDPERSARLATWLVGSARFQTRRIGLIASETREKSWAEPLIAAKYRIDPPLLLAILRYYHLHPESRNELETTAARDRIRRCDFPGIELSLDPGVPRGELMSYTLRGPAGYGPPTVTPRR